ncbi:MAG: FtsQ-type POTRA domain-containing protein [Candidatus Omnitrophica bacterium]|nr:FtsQ-type POTRA domain-containing protein [Candidatus Omnitrophota bacterium]
MAKKRRRKASRSSIFSQVWTSLVAASKLLWRVLPLAVILNLAVFVLIGIKGGLYADSGLLVHRLEVRPPEALSQETIQRLEKRLFGKNILRVNLSSLAEELEKDPEILKAELSRHFPSQIQIKVSRRFPVASIRFSPKGNWGLISEDGMILSVLEKPDASLCLVEAFTLGKKEPRVGEKIKSHGFQEAMTFLKAFWENPLSTQEALTKIGLDSGGHVTIMLGAGPQIRLGRKPLDHLEAFQKIAYLLESDERYKIDYIDLQFENIIVKRKGNG